MADAPPTHAEAEQRMRELLRDNGLPEPDSVRYHADEVAFFWHDSKTVVIVDLVADDIGQPAPST
jgi:hypothetical protein